MDAIVAAATPPGRSAVAMVRITGKDALAVLERLGRPLLSRPLSPGRARRFVLVDSEGTYDDAVVVVAKAPRTYTGDDLVEITTHGNTFIVGRLLDAAVDAGARLAEPGEFTRRAVLNGRMDLVAAEATLQAAEASTRRGLGVARSGLDGTLAAHFAESRKRLVVVAADLEARLDYPADELAFFDDDHLVGELDEIANCCHSLGESYRVGRIVVEGARVAIVGPVNAGKSSLFNAMVGRPRALVHETPGTTRDVVESGVELGDVAMTLLDTAGERDTTDPVEAAGLALSRELVEETDLLVVVVRAKAGGLDTAEKEILARTASRPRIVVYNGVDRVDAGVAPEGAVCTSARTGEGLLRLREAIRAALVEDPTGRDGPLVASARQRDRLLAVEALLRESARALGEAGPAAAVDAVARALGEIDSLTGADTQKDVLDEVFSRFCIGK